MTAAMRLDAVTGNLTLNTGALAINDTSVARVASGVLEINNGTAGQHRDLKIRTLTLAGATTVNISAPAASTGTVLTDNGTWQALPASTAVAMVPPPLVTLADARGKIGDMCYDPATPQYLFTKIGIAPHKWVYSSVFDTL